MAVRSGLWATIAFCGLSIPELSASQAAVVHMNHFFQWRNANMHLLKLFCSKCIRSLGFLLQSAVHSTDEAFDSEAQYVRLTSCITSTLAIF